MPQRHTNSLIRESSPYLLQHAHNPVQWLAWNDETLEKARREKKMMLISIGYSACHWCHVMERESFEDETVASLMNEHFICVKIDREERPDIDQVYMNAVQLMTGHGGWPLNCFTLPDGRPVYGGTYFPKQAWMNVLNSLMSLYKNEKNKILEYAGKLTQGIQLDELPLQKDKAGKIDIQLLHESVKKWSDRFDNIEGGPDKAPKFPLPNNYQFLLRYAHTTKNESLMQHIQLTLKKMAYGGIYDHAGGGFARYSTDKVWKVPHFEKMLYDNAQLVSLYSEAYLVGKDPLYKEVVYETLEFIRRELTSPEGAFYCALDADTEGVEGKYYVWTKEELKNALGADDHLASEYFSVCEAEAWEHGTYILIRKKEIPEIAGLLQLSEEALKIRILHIKKKLLEKREERVRPGLDNKCLTSWNALMMKAYADAYRVFEEQTFLEAAITNANLLLTKFRKPDGSLFHCYTNGKPAIEGFLEDYAFLTEGLLALYTVTFDEKWVLAAGELAEYVLKNFSDESSSLLFFTSHAVNPLIARKKEISDNVIPASNSTMAKSLFFLGHYFSESRYTNRSQKMLEEVSGLIPVYGAGYSNWAMLMLHFTQPFHEVVIVGKDVDKMRKEFSKIYIPNLTFAGCERSGKLPLLNNRYTEGKTMIYVCENNTCKQPVEHVEEALMLINGKR